MPHCYRRRSMGICGITTALLVETSACRRLVAPDLRHNGLDTMEEAGWPGGDGTPRRRNWWPVADAEPAPGGGPGRGVHLRGVLRRRGTWCRSSTRWCAGSTPTGHGGGAAPFGFSRQSYYPAAPRLPRAAWRPGPRQARPEGRAQAHRRGPRPPPGAAGRDPALRGRAGRRSPTGSASRAPALDRTGPGPPAGRNTKWLTHAPDSAAAAALEPPTGLVTNGCGSGC